MGVQLTYDEQRLAGTFCTLHSHGDGWYCTAHSAKGKNDRVCDEAEEMARKLIGHHTSRKENERGQRRGYPW